MELTKMVRIDDQEVTIQISGEDAVAAIFDENPEYAPIFLLKRACNNMASFFNKMPQPLIDELTHAQRKLVADYLDTLAERFRPPAPPP